MKSMIGYVTVYKACDRTISSIVDVGFDDEDHELSRFSSRLLVLSCPPLVSSPPFLHILLGRRPVVAGE